MNNRITVAEFRCIFNFYIYTAQFLNNIFCNKSGMPAGTAGNNYNAIGVADLIGKFFNAAECNLMGLQIKTSTHGVKDRLRLLKDLFQHKVIKAPFFNS